MFSAIDHAIDSVYLEMYTFENDVEHIDFASLLQKKARSGLRVVLILDTYGSGTLESDTIQLLRDSGVEVLFYSVIFQRTHRKFFERNDDCVLPKN